MDLYKYFRKRIIETKKNERIRRKDLFFSPFGISSAEKEQKRNSSRLRNKKKEEKGRKEKQKGSKEEEERKIKKIVPVAAKVGLDH